MGVVKSLFVGIFWVRYFINFDFNKIRNYFNLSLNHCFSLLISDRCYLDDNRYVPKVRLKESYSK